MSCQEGAFEDDWAPRPQDNFSEDNDGAQNEGDEADNVKHGEQAEDSENT